MAEDMRQYYVDQSPIINPLCSATYTPWGIRLIDTGFCRDIIAATSVGECREISKRLRKNPHLHRRVKANLYLNLRRKLHSLRGRT